MAKFVLEAEWGWICEIPPWSCGIGQGSGGTRHRLVVEVVPGNPPNGRIWVIPVMDEVPGFTSSEHLCGWEVKMLYS